MTPLPTPIETNTVPPSPTPSDLLWATFSAFLGVLCWTFALSIISTYQLYGLGLLVVGFGLCLPLLNTITDSTSPDGATDDSTSPDSATDDSTSPDGATDDSTSPDSARRTPAWFFAVAVVVFTVFAALSFNPVQPPLDLRWPQDASRIELREGQVTAVGMTLWGLAMLAAVWWALEGAARAVPAPVVVRGGPRRWWIDVLLLHGIALGMVGLFSVYPATTRPNAAQITVIGAGSEWLLRPYSITWRNGEEAGPLYGPALAGLSAFNNGLIGLASLRVIGMIALLLVPYSVYLLLLWTLDRHSARVAGLCAAAGACMLWGISMAALGNPWLIGMAWALLALLALAWAQRAQSARSVTIGYLVAGGAVAVGALFVTPMWWLVWLLPASALSQAFAQTPIATPPAPTGGRVATARRWAAAWGACLGPMLFGVLLCAVLLAPSVWLHPWRYLPYIERYSLFDTGVQPLYAMGEAWAQGLLSFTLARDPQGLAHGMFQRAALIPPLGALWLLGVCILLWRTVYGAGQARGVALYSLAAQAITLLPMALRVTVPPSAPDFWWSAPALPLALLLVGIGIDTLAHGVGIFAAGYAYRVRRLLFGAGVSIVLLWCIVDALTR
jgi:hypothetical protein